MNERLRRFILEAIEPDVPEHLYEQEYDAASGMFLEDFLEEVGQPDLISEASRIRQITFDLAVEKNIRALIDAGNIGFANELYAQLAALATRRAAARIPELGYWD